MNWRDHTIGFHPDTILIVEIAELFLQQYFGHSRAEAETVLSGYFALKKGWIDEGYIRHEHAWGVTLEAEYRVHVGGPAGAVSEWIRAKGLERTPPDALEYLRKHYWNRNSEH